MVFLGVVGTPFLDQMFPSIRRRIQRDSPSQICVKVTAKDTMSIF